MTHIFNELESWFVHRPPWLQDAARRIVQKGVLDNNDFAELITLCKKETGLTDPNAPDIQPQGIPAGAFELNETPITLRLEEISNVKGINALSPRKPLEFGEEPITIITYKCACGNYKQTELKGHFEASG